MQRFLELRREDVVAEGRFVVVDGLVLDLVVLDEILGSGFEDEAVFFGPVGAESFVDAGDDFGQVFFFWVGERSRTGIESDDFSRTVGHWYLSVSKRVPVSGSGVLDILAGLRVLQLGRSYRDTVHEQRQINCLVARWFVSKLAGHGQHVRLVPFHQLRSQPASGSEERQPDSHIPVHHPVAEHVHSPPFVELRRQPLHETGPGQHLVAAVPDVHQPDPLARLGRADELEQISSVQPGYAIEVGFPIGRPILAVPVAAMLDQEPGDVSLERRLVNRTHPSITILQILMIQAF